MTKLAGSCQCGTHKFGYRRIASLSLRRFW